MKPDMLPQHAVYIEKLRAARAIGGAAPDLQWAVAEGPGFVQGTSMYFKTWAERDQWQNVMVKVYGQAEADRLLASRRETLVSTETFVLRHRPDLSRAAASTTTSSRP